MTAAAARCLSSKPTTTAARPQRPGAHGDPQQPLQDRRGRTRHVRGGAYLPREALPRGTEPEETGQAYVEIAPDVLGYLPGRTRPRLQAIRTHADYDADLPGGEPGGRSGERSGRRRSHFRSAGGYISPAYFVCAGG